MKRGGWEEGSVATGATPGLKPKPYLSIEELSALTPWTEQAVRSKIKRGDFIADVHFFRIGRRIIFKWDAVVNLIENRVAVLTPIPQRPRRHESEKA
jgi:hypothetical protein